MPRLNHCIRPSKRVVPGWRSLAAVGCPLLLATGAVSNDYTVTAVGSFFCYDGSTNTTVPLAGARILLMDSDCDGSTICDDVMGSGHIAADGSFRVTGRGGDPGDWSWSRPDVYLRVVYNDDQGVRETDELDRDRSTDTPQHDHDNTPDGSTVDFGAWVAGTGVNAGEATQCGVWLAGRKAYQDYVTLMGENPPAGHWDIEYWSAIWAGTPWTNDNTTHWPIHYTSWTALHEFGHTIRHAADGDRNHFNWDVTRFRYARSHSRCDPNANRIGTDTRTMDLAYGFNEGWAEFWEGQVSGCWAVSIEDALEGNVAFALNVIANRPGVGKTTMVEVLKANPGQIHSLDEFIAALSSGLGMSSSPLVQAIDSARQVPIRAATDASSPISTRRAREVMQATVASAQSSLRRLERELAVASDAARGVRTCTRDDCETLIRTATRPVMLRAEIEAQRLALRRLEMVARLTGDEAFMQKLALGDLDSTLSRMRAEGRGQGLRIYGRAFEEAGQVAARVARGSPAGEALARELSAQLDSLREVSRRGGEIQLTTRAEIGEAAVPRRQ